MSQKENKENFSLDFTKFQPFMDDVKTKNQNFDEMLNTSVKHMVSQEDTISYTPQNIINFPTILPNIPPTMNVDLFEKFDECTLMFIFFYQNNNHAKYNAGKVLSKRGWMFNKKYGTWFEAIKPLKTTTDEYIEGKFKYWDFDNEWAPVLKKKEIKFEFKNLETYE